MANHLGQGEGRLVTSLEELRTCNLHKAAWSRQTQGQTCKKGKLDYFSSSSTERGPDEANHKPNHEAPKGPWLVGAGPEDGEQVDGADGRREVAGQVGGKGELPGDGLDVVEELAALTHLKTGWSNCQGGRKKDTIKN